MLYLARSPQAIIPPICNSSSRRLAVVFVVFVLVRAHPPNNQSDTLKNKKGFSKCEYTTFTSLSLCLPSVARTKKEEEQEEERKRERRIKQGPKTSQLIPTYLSRHLPPSLPFPNPKIHPTHFPFSNHLGLSLEAVGPAKKGRTSGGEAIHTAFSPPRSPPPTGPG